MSIQEAYSLMREDIKDIVQEVVRTELLRHTKNAVERYGKANELFTKSRVIEYLGCNPDSFEVNLSEGLIVPILLGSQIFFVKHDLDYIRY